MSGSILDSVVEELQRLPGIGAKTAERLAYHLLKVSSREALGLAEAIRRLKEEVRECQRCHNITEAELCNVCTDPGREQHVVCVVEQPKDLQALESTGRYRGLYHVLGGNFAPLEDRGPDSLTLDHLRNRVRDEGIEEVILATNPNFEGDGTALLISEVLERTGVSVSRLARGIPSGSQIEYMNSSILSDALDGRRTVVSADGPSAGDGPSKSLHSGQGTPDEQ
ncbi:MAG: recombination mediator RecR [Planctomycetota bacterium]